MKGFDIFHLDQYIIVNNTRIGSTKYRHYYETILGDKIDKKRHTTKGILYSVEDKVKIIYTDKRQLLFKELIETDITTKPVFILIRDPYKRLLSSLAHFSFTIAPFKFEKIYNSIYTEYPEVEEKLKTLIYTDRGTIYRLCEDKLVSSKIVEEYEGTIAIVLDFILKNISIEYILEDIHFTPHHKEVAQFLDQFKIVPENIFLTDIENLGGERINSSYLINKTINKILNKNPIEPLNDYLKQEQSYYSRLKTEYNHLILNYEQTRIIRAD